MALVCTYFEQFVADADAAVVGGDRAGLVADDEHAHRGQVAVAGQTQADAGGAGAARGLLVAVAAVQLHQVKIAVQIAVQPQHLLCTTTTAQPITAVPPLHATTTESMTNFRRVVTDLPTKRI